MAGSFETKSSPKHFKEVPFYGKNFRRNLSSKVPIQLSTYVPNEIDTP
jgi:hypothetical protein